MIKRFSILMCVFVLVPAFIDNDLFWLSGLYNGEGTDEAQRLMALVWFMLCLGVGFSIPKD